MVSNLHFTTKGSLPILVQLLNMCRCELSAMHEFVINNAFFQFSLSVAWISHELSFNCCLCCIYIYIYIYSKYTQERRTTISDKLLRISTFQITSNNITFYKFYNITSYFYRNILLSVPSKYQMQLKTSSENVWNNYLIIL